jgi:hypothetical protein
MIRNRKSVFLREPTPAPSKASDVAPGRGGWSCPAGGTKAPDDGIDICTKPWEEIADLKADLRAEGCRLMGHNVTAARAAWDFSAENGSKVYEI